MNSSVLSSVQSKKSAAGALLTALLFGITGAIFGLHKLAESVLGAILVPDPSLAFREVSDSLPVPRLLDWNVPLMQALTALRDMHGPVLAALATVLLAVLGGLFLFIVLHDSAAPGDSRPASLPAEDSTDITAQKPVEQEAAVTESDPSTSPDTAPPSNDAAAPSDSHPVPRPEPKPLQRAGRRSNWPLPLLLYTVCVALLACFGSHSVSETMLRYYRTLGTFHQGYFQQIAVPSVGSSIALWAGVGLALNALCVAGRQSAQRAAVAGSAIALLGLAAWWFQAIPARTNMPGRDWTPAILTAVPYRSPFGVPDGPNAAELLAKQAKLTFGDQSAQRSHPLVMLVPTGALNMTIEGITEDGLTASLDSGKAARAFLDRRHYESALSWIAIKHSFGVATVHFDTTSAIETCMTDMEKCPHLAQCGQATRAMLFTCAASPANLALLDRWADERNFVCPTRDSRRLMGQLFERFGQPAKALVWYKRADMPKSFLSRVQNEKPLFNAGRIFGKLMLNGKPLVGVQVGVIPRRLNGLPPDMEPDVLRARGDVIAFRPQRTFPQHHPVPFSLRWVSASSITDSSGGFEMTNLTEGEYILVFTLPPTVQLNSPVDPRLTISNPPPPLNVRYKIPFRDAGTIGINIGK